MNSKKNKDLDIIQQIFQATYFIVYRKIFYRKKTTIEIIDIVKYERRRKAFDIMHIPFISFVLAILIFICFIFQINIIVSILIFGGFFLLLYKLNNLKRRYFINQKRYQTILRKKWSDFSITSRIGAIIYLIIMQSIYLFIIFIIFLHFTSQ
ncbi:MAG: hypothetical protein U0U66_03265 [Cytophagaceae bacterium]